MNKKSLRLPIVISLLVITACARSGEGQLATPEMISQALPTITEMPGDWNETQRQIFETREPENPSIDPSVWCSAAQEVTKNLIELAGSSGADVEMQAETQTGGARLMRVQAWSNSNVSKYYGDAKEAVRICDGTSSTDENGVVATTTVIQNRDIGDESISWEQRTTPTKSLQEEKFESLGRTTIARFGDIVMVIQIGDAAPVGTVTMFDEDQWWSIVELAGRKLDKLSEQVHD